MTLLVFTTCPTRSIAQKLAQQIISKKLAACAQISSAIESHYVWKGRRTKTKEFSVCFKTTVKNGKQLEKAILEIHPYEVPEIISLKAHSVLPAYLRWIASSAA